MNVFNKKVKKCTTEEELVEVLLAHEDLIKGRGGEKEESTTIARRREEANPAVSYCCTQQESRKRKATKHSNKPEFDPLTLVHTCRSCGSRDIYEDRRGGELICEECGTCEDNRITTDAYKCMSFDDYGAMKSTVDANTRKNFYKRINYFNELLLHLTGTQNKKIPEEVYRRVEKRLEGNAPICGKSVRWALKKEKLGRLYEHSYLIANRLSGNASLVELDHIEREVLCTMFKKLQEPFEKFKEDRKNCLNYPYILFQLFRLINREDLCEHVEMLKCAVRLREHDRLWKRVCADMSWNFHPVTT